MSFSHLHVNYVGNIAYSGMDQLGDRRNVGRQSMLALADDDSEQDVQEVTVDEASQLSGMMNYEFFVVRPELQRMESCNGSHLCSSIVLTLGSTNNATKNRRENVKWTEASMTMLARWMMQEEIWTFPVKSNT